VAHGVFKDRKSADSEDVAHKKYSAKREHRGGATTRRDAHQWQERPALPIDGYKPTHRHIGSA
jgi:hypothetical protein